MVVRHLAPRRKLHDVLTHEHPRLLLRGVLVIGVVIPVEIGLRSGREKPEQPLLALRQGVEARHDIAPRLGKRERPLADAVGGRSLDHPAVGDAQLREPRPEAAVDRPEGLPDRQKTPLLGRKVRLGAQRRPESHDLQLRRCEVGNVGFELLDLRNVAEQLVGIDGVFVDRVEIRQQQVAPEIELVERFVVVLRVDLVELRDEAHAVARTKPRDFAHQFVDRRPRGLPHRPVGNLRQRIDEKQTRTPRRKQHRAFRKRRPVTGIQICGYFVKKTLHGRMSGPERSSEREGGIKNRGEKSGRKYRPDADPTPVLTP